MPETILAREVIQRILPAHLPGRAANTSDPA